MTTFWMDFETFCIQPGMAAPPPVCLAFAIDDGVPELVHARDQRFRQLLDVALEPGVKLVAHNAVYEVLVILANLPEFRRRVFAKLRAGEVSCTNVREKLLRIGEGNRNRGTAIDDCLKFHGLRVPASMDSDWRLRYGSLWGVDVPGWPQEAVDYALGDISVRELWHAQAARGAQFYVNEAAQVEAAVALGLSSAWGLMTDRSAAEELERATLEDIERDKKILAQAGLLKFEGAHKVTKDKKAAEELLIQAFEDRGLEVPRGDLTDKMKAKGVLEGNVKLDEEACLASGDPVLAAYTRFSQANTLLSKVRRLKWPLIQPRYDVLGAASGRTTGSQGDDPKPGEAWTSWGTQIQNPPRKEGVRECYVARPRKAKVSIDFDTFELRTWSQVCLWLFGYSDMAVVLRDPNRDVHVELGAAIYGMTAAEAYALKKTNKALFKELRQAAKAVNFGAPGGLGAKTFVEFALGTYELDLGAQPQAPEALIAELPRGASESEKERLRRLWDEGHGITREEAAQARARQLLGIWKSTWREAGAYLDFVSQQLGKRGARGQLTHFVSQRLRGDVGYCDYANSLFQGLASDAAKAGFVRLMYAMYDEPESLVYGCRMLAFIHDEVILEIPLDTLHDTSYAARDLFVGGAQKFVPDVPLTASPAAMTRWSKKYGDPVHDENGRLVPGEWAESKKSAA